jgi:hypothetical protein
VADTDAIIETRTRFGDVEVDTAAHCRLLSRVCLATIDPRSANASTAKVDFVMKYSVSADRSRKQSGDIPDSNAVASTSG